MTSTFTSTHTFTRTHARHLGAKIAADLRQCATLHGEPSANRVDAYLEELVELLVGGYVSEYEFGFKQNDRRIVCWRYVITSDGSIDSVTGDPGGLYARDVPASARYYNFLSYSSAWAALSTAEQQRIKDGLPVRRTSGSLPGDGDGYWHEAREYGAGGVRVTRREYRPL
jgi:hypothetical protein